MIHLSEEELILHYYGEEGDTFVAEHHLEECEDCRRQYNSLQRVLNVVDTLPVPVRGPEYGAEVWRRIENRIPSRRRWWNVEWRWAAAAAAVASLCITAFLAGRFYPGPQHKVAPVVETAADRQAGQRVLLVAVGDFLERSQMVLIELNNAKPGKLDISAERERAADLVSENRLYRQTAAHTGDTAMAGVLDELERVLVDISHEPSDMSAAQLENLQQRMESAGILFKVRILGTNVKNQQDPGKPVGRPAGGQKL